MNTSDPEQKTPATTPEQPAIVKRTIPSQEILAGEKEVWIQHGDSVYRLCETKSGKLILQK